LGAYRAGDLTGRSPHFALPIIEARDRFALEEYYVKRLAITYGHRRTSSTASGYSPSLCSGDLRPFPKGEGNGLR